MRDPSEPVLVKVYDGKTTPNQIVISAWTSWDQQKHQGDPQKKPLIIYCKVEKDEKPISGLDIIAIVQYKDDYGVTQRKITLVDDGRAGKYRIILLNRFF